MLDWLRGFLQRRLDKKKQEVIRLRWQQARLQKELDKIRENRP